MLLRSFEKKGQEIWLYKRVTLSHKTHIAKIFSEKELRKLSVQKRYIILYIALYTLSYLHVSIIQFDLIIKFLFKV